jgi:hypothetical protein
MSGPIGPDRPEAGKSWVRLHPSQSPGAQHLGERGQSEVTWRFHRSHLP